VLLAGVSYKRNVDDMRESPALDVMAHLKARGAEIAYVDPHVPVLRGSMWHGGSDLETIDLASTPTGAFDCVVIVTDHAAFDTTELQRVGTVVVDTRNAIANPGPNVVRLGAPRPAANAVVAVG
jgi:UDP-N-acetyl-D-glucosamine dehydrogenase